MADANLIFASPRRMKTLRNGDYMEDLKLCDSDYKFMTIVWEACPGELGGTGEAVCEKLGWKKSTTYTVIKKLCQRALSEMSRRW